MKTKVSIDLLKDIFENFYSCKGCKYNGTNCVGKSCEEAKFETLIEKSKLALDFDLALLELEKLKRKCTGIQFDGVLFAIEKLKEIKKEIQTDYPYQNQ